MKSCLYDVIFNKVDSINSVNLVFLRFFFGVMIYVSKVVMLIVIKGKRFVVVN